MAWSDDTYIAAFDAVVGSDLGALATAGQKIIWYNEGQARLLQRKATSQDITWTSGDRSKALHATFIQLDKIVFDDDSTVQPWRVWGRTLVIDDPNGVSADGGARVYFWGEFAEMTTSTTATETTIAQDYAILNYCLSRFYRKLASNRAFYKRYATLVGQNAVSQTDLAQEAQAYYNDFLDARGDLEPDPPAFFYDSYE
jgi:hypothetical protein